MSGQGVTEFFELGAGKVLSGLIRRIADGIATASIGAPADVEAFKSARAAEPKSL
jgi:[acyl-carrier-protein] S-malonyltransferase